MSDITSFSVLHPAQALARIRPLIKKTPVMRCDELDHAAGCRLVFKCEHLQHTGSFKLRGASYAVSRLGDDCPGVATHSSGNHGAALAAAASARGFSAQVVMPENAVKTKIAAVRHHGGQVHFCQPTQAAREQGLARLVEQGLVAIPPYDHDDIIMGQGTLASELLEQVDDLDVIIAPIGGGGMLAGITLAAAAHQRPVRVVGAEPLAANDTARSLAAGQRVEDHQPNTIADGLRALVGKRNLTILLNHKIEVLTVTEQQILEAMARLFNQMKQVIEPSGAVALAAVLNHQNLFTGKKVGVILSGGNLDLQPFFTHLEAL